MKRVGAVIALTISLIAFATFVFIYVQSSFQSQAQDTVKEQQATQHAQQFLATPPPRTTDQSPAIAQSSAAPEPTYQVSPGVTFAVIDIPKIGIEYPVGEGVDLSLLATSVGHYQGTAMPGQTGNASFAGHDCCREHGSPFVNLKNMNVGDQVFVTTATNKYTYAVVSMPSCGADVPLVVDVHKTDVLNPLPCTTDAPNRRLITLTTCTPGGPNPTPWRLIVFAELITSEAR